MRFKKLFLLAGLAVSVIFASAAAEAAHHKRDKRPSEGSAMRPQLSEEARKLAAAYRSDPSHANRSALKRQIGIEYDRFLKEQRAKLKGGKNSQAARRRLDALKRDRDKHIEKIMERLLNPQARPGGRPNRKRD